MAQYAALWTSSRDPEYIQIKKVKQLTERCLAMNLMTLNTEHRRYVKKVQGHISENQEILEKLEQEKETIARSILSRFHRYHRQKDALSKLKCQIQKWRHNDDQHPCKPIKLPFLKKGSQPHETKKNILKPEAKIKSYKSPSTHQVIMTHTFPYVYHSHGDKPCPRYDMFLQSNEYGPQELTSKKKQRSQQDGQQKLTKLAKPEMNSNDNQLPSISMTSSRRSSSLGSLKTISLALKAMNGMVRNER